MKPVPTTITLVIGLAVGFWIGSFLAGQRARVAVLAGSHSDNFGPALQALAHAKAKLRSGDTNVTQQLQAAETQIRAARDCLGVFSDKQMKVTDDLIKAAIQTHIESGLAMRGIRMRQQFPELGFDGTREVYAIADKAIRLGWRLALESQTDPALDHATAAQRIVEAVPGISEHNARLIVDETFRARGKL